MKKLMIAAAIVCAAALSQAASFTWGTDAQAYGPAVANLTVPGYYAPGTANADRMKAEGSSQGIVWAYEFILSDGLSSETLTGTISSYSSNKINQGIESTLFSLPAAGADAKTYSWEIVITGTSADGNYTYTSDAITGSAEYTSFSDTRIETTAPAHWTVAAVPEPTSGLLLLLGVGAMALRRRRA